MQDTLKYQVGEKHPFPCLNSHFHFIFSLKYQVGGKTSRFTFSSSRLVFKSFSEPFLLFSTRFSQIPSNKSTVNNCFETFVRSAKALETSLNKTTIWYTCQNTHCSKTKMPLILMNGFSQLIRVHKRQLIERVRLDQVH